MHHFLNSTLPSLVLATLVALSYLVSPCLAQVETIPVEKVTAEPALIAILTNNDAPRADKAMACKRLTVYGSPAAVPELAKLLSDAELASWTRIAL